MLTVSVGGPKPTQLVFKGQGNAILINKDLLNSVQLSDSISFSPGFTSSLGPQQVLTVDGTTDIWALPVIFGQNVMVEVTNTGVLGIDTSTLANVIAAAFKQSGVPPIDNPAAVFIVINQTVAAGATFTPSPGHFSVGKFQSWFATMFCTATSSGLGGTPYTKFSMTWSIASDNFDPLITHDWTVPNTPFNFLYNYRNDCQGPVFGDTLDMSFKNYDSQPVNVTIGLFGSFRTRIKPKITGRYHYNTGTGAPDDTRGTGSDGIVDVFNPTGLPLAPGGVSNVELMNLHDGPAVLTGNVVYSAAGQADFQLVITGQPSGIIGAGYTIQQRGTAVTPGVSTPFQAIPPTLLILPRRVCTIQLINLTSSVGNISSAQAVITGQEQPE